MLLTYVEGASVISKLALSVYSTVVTANEYPLSSEVQSTMDRNFTEQNAPASKSIMALELLEPAHDLSPQC
jgi:hypothetical protein